MTTTMRIVRASEMVTCPNGHSSCWSPRCYLDAPLRRSEKPVFYLETARGGRYHIFANGNIARLDLPGFVPSGQWKFLGLRSVRSRCFLCLDVLLAGGVPTDMLYKNGNPQWTVRDSDHGTVREWGNTKYYGVKVLRRLA